MRKLLFIVVKDDNNYDKSIIAEVSYCFLKLLLLPFTSSLPTPSSSPI